MAERDLTSGGARAVLGVSVLVLLSCAVGNVLLAVTESVWWPLVAAVVWWGAAAGVTAWATAASTSRSRRRRVASERVAAGVSAHRR
jgi:membrane protein YdbS with pleckstrin-like domain